MTPGLPHKKTIMMPLIQALHGIAATAWIGGIFFAFMALRPAANKILEPNKRLQLWQSAYSYFFPWVWIFIGLLLATGYLDLFLRFGGFSNGALYLGLMHATGLLMISLFVYLYFGLYRRLKAAIISSDTSTAAKVMNKMRPIMAINLSLGLLITFIGIAGPSL